MSSKTTKTTNSARPEVVGAKFYDKFLETFVKICVEEDVNRIPQIAVVDKSGVQIAEPETISRKLSQIEASLEKVRVQSTTWETNTLNQSQAASVDKRGVQIAPKRITSASDHKKEGAPVKGAIPQQDIGADEAGDQISAPVTCPQEEVCRRKKGQLKITCGRPETLTAVAMKSSRIESALLRSITACVSWFPTISQLKLENCRLKPEDVFLIAVVFRDTNSLKQLVLDDNPLGDMCYSCLLQMSSSLQLLSLCGCQLGDLGMVYLSSALEDEGVTAAPLVRLNLANNRITCKGAQILANTLRTNRTLLSVTLSGNQIHNTGAIALAEVLQRFQLRHDECVERRGRYFSENLKQKSRIGIIQDQYPYLTEVEWDTGAQYCKGNFTLLHLNLSYNSIGLPGLLAFHQAILYQEGVLQPPNKGLLSLYLQGNRFPEDRPELEEMSKIFSARLDLLRKSPKTSSLESGRSSSKTSGLSSSRADSKSRELEKGNYKISDTASVK